MSKQEEGLFSKGKKLLLEEEEVKLRRDKDELAKTKQKLNETSRELEQLQKFQTTKLGDFNLIDSKFTGSLLATMKSLVDGYVDTLSKTQAKIDMLAKENRQVVSTLQKTVDDDALMFEKIMATLQEIVYVLGKNADLEKTVLEKLNSELSR